MKEIIVAVVCAGFMFGCATTSVKESKSNLVKTEVKESKVEVKKVFDKNVENLKIEEKDNSVLLSWEIKDEADVGKIQIMRIQTKNEERYSEVKSLKPDARSVELPQNPLIVTKYKIVLISNDKVRSSGIETKEVVLKHKNVLLDKVEDKDIFVYLPDGYEASENSYPVAYMLDGQNLFIDGYGSTYEWKVDETLKQLKKDGKVDDIIVVGIFSDSKRDEEYISYKLKKEDGYLTEDFQGKGKEFGEFIVKKIIPYIENKYKVSKDRKDRAIMGASLGGLMTMYMINMYPDVFSMAAVMSPWFPEDMISDVKNSSVTDCKFWIDSGSLDISEIIPKARQLTDLLVDKGYRYGEQIVFYEEKGAAHGELDWAGRVEYPFIMFKGKPAKEIMTMKIETYTVKNEGTGKITCYVNPVGIYDNGMKYSLYRTAKYEVVNSDDGKINEDGEITFIGKKDLEIIIKNGDLERRMAVKYSEFTNKLGE